MQTNIKLANFDIIHSLFYTIVFLQWILLYYTHIEGRIHE